MSLCGLSEVNEATVEGDGGGVRERASVIGAVVEALSREDERVMLYEAQFEYGGGQGGDGGGGAVGDGVEVILGGECDIAIGGDGESGDLTEFGECCEARCDGVLLERTVGSGDAPEGARIFEGGAEVVILVYGQGNEV